MKTKKIIKLFCYLVAISIMITWQTQAIAYSMSSTAQAVMNYETELSVEAIEPRIVLDFSGTGSADFDFEFAVISNTPEVQMYVEATDFIFADQEKKVPSIPLNTDLGARIDPVGAEGAARTAKFVGSGDAIKGLESSKTEILKFSSPDSLDFKHQVFVKLEWSQVQEQRPAGEYVANVRLTCFINP